MDTIRSWKDPEYRHSLGQAAPAHPAGEAGLAPISEAELFDAVGADHTPTGVFGTLGCCWCLPWYSGWTVCGLICNPGKPCHP